ncbi:MAG: hypothetical protein UHE93_07470 [Muribaculaceae bacterium]|nr:hypothetical protein [Muribaculaceae bacterium]
MGLLLDDGMELKGKMRRGIDDGDAMMHFLTEGLKDGEDAGG